MALSSFLLTEVARIPLSCGRCWAILPRREPSIRNDLLAVAGITLAVLARTQFYVLAAILPVAMLGHAVVEHRPRLRSARIERSLGAYCPRHPATIALIVDRPSVLGTYSQTTGGNPLPLGSSASPGTPGSRRACGRPASLLAGGGWLLSNLRQSETPSAPSFAWVGVVTVVVLTFEVASFDLRFGGGVVRERYLFYLDAILLIALAAGSRLYVRLDGHCCSPAGSSRSAFCRRRSRPSRS